MQESILPTHPLFENLTDQVFGKRTVLSYYGKKGNHHYWNCRCQCGTITVACASNLRKTKGCRCVVSEVGHVVNWKHGGCGTRQYRIYLGMIRRCNDKKRDGYRDYGGRGIAVCSRWIGEIGFVNFMADMPECPSTSHSIDRIKNDLGYEPGNCKWSTSREQSRNKRNSVFATYAGETKLLIEHCEQNHKLYHVVHKRLKIGWTIDEAMNIPVGQKREHKEA